MSPSENPRENASLVSSRRKSSKCGARVKRDRFCARRAGQGTDHEGIGLCDRHGGNSEHQLKRAGMVMAHEGIMNPDIHPGDVVEIEPGTALLWSVMIAGGDVSYWQARLNTLGDELNEAIAEDDADEEKRIRAEIKTAYGQVRTANREMRSAGKMATDAGLAERQVMMAERMSGLLAQFSESVFSEIDLTPDQMRRLPQIVERAIMNLQQPEGTMARKPQMALTAYKKADIFEVED